MVRVNTSRCRCGVIFAKPEETIKQQTGSALWNELLKTNKNCAQPSLRVYCRLKKCTSVVNALDEGRFIFHTRVSSLKMRKLGHYSTLKSLLAKNNRRIVKVLK